MMTAIELSVVVPGSLSFGDLRLHVTSNGRVSLEWAPVAALCQASGIAEDDLRNGPAVLLPLVLRGWLELLADRGTPFSGHVEASNIIDRMMAEAADEAPPFALQVTIGREGEGVEKVAGRTLH